MYFRMKPISGIDLNKQKNIKSHNIHNSMKFVIRLANCFALLPVEGATQNDLDYLQFRWKSLKIFYAIITLLAAGYTLGTGIVYLIKISSFEMIGTK